LEWATHGTPETPDDEWIVKSAELAVYWGLNPSNASLIGSLPLDTKSRALGINDAGEITGWSGSSEWTGSGVVTSSAFLCRNLGVIPINLNDEHFVHGLTGWQLSVANSINNQGWIGGIGNKNGLTRGFVLRKLQLAP